MIFTNILVPLDTTYSSASWAKASITLAADIARQSGGRLHFVTVVPDNLLKGYYPDIYSDTVRGESLVKLRQMVAEHLPDPGSTEYRVETGGICREIIRLARQIPADLIVMASHGPIARDYVLGSNAAYIALHAPCSIFIARDQPTSQSA